MKAVKGEPVMITAALIAIVDVLVSYGVIQADKTQAIVAAVTAVVTLLAGVFARSQVTPV